jgi:light-regulated signal transduction histidine kinase (bacteriophytochrome)
MDTKVKKRQRKELDKIKKLEQRHQTSK